MRRTIIMDVPKMTSLYDYDNNLKTTLRLLLMLEDVSSPQGLSSEQQIYSEN